MLYYLMVCKCRSFPLLQGFNVNFVCSFCFQVILVQSLHLLFLNSRDNTVVLYTSPDSNWICLWIYNYQLGSLMWLYSVLVAYKIEAHPFFGGNYSCNQLILFVKLVLRCSGYGWNYLLLCKWSSSRYLAI